MKALLARFAARKAFGVYVADDELVVSKVAATPFGPVEISCKYERAESHNRIDVLSRLIGRRGRIRTPISVGIPAHHVFFSTRPIRSGSQDASAKALLHEVLQSSMVHIEDTSIDVIRSEPGGRSVASIASCSKKYLSEVLDCFVRIGARPYRVEPAPCALLRAAARTHAAGRRVKADLRIFLGDSQGLAVLATPQLPAVWRYFDLTRGDEASAIVSITRSLQALSKPCGINTPLDAVFIHGRNDLRTLVEMEGLSDRIGIHWTWCDAPGLNHGSIAFGLAIGALYSDEIAFDLAQAMKTPPTLGDIVPWGELALQGSLIFCMGLFLANRAWAKDQAARTVQAEIAQNNWLSQTSDSALDKERNELTQKVEAIRKFVNGRIQWTGYTHDLSASLPARASIHSIHGVSELEPFTAKQGGTARLKKTLVLRGAAPIAANGAVPIEIDQFMDRLRDSNRLQHDLPEIELADIKWFQPLTGAPPNAQFTIVCLPKTPKNSKPNPRSEAEANKGE